MSRTFPSSDKEVTVLSGAAIFIKKEKLSKKFRGLTKKIFLYHEDDDISIRLKNEVGPLFYVHNAVIKHVGGSSSSRDKSIAATVLSYGQIKSLFAKNTIIKQLQ